MTRDSGQAGQDLARGRLLCALDDEAAEVVPSVLALPVLRHTRLQRDSERIERRIWQRCLWVPETMSWLVSRHFGTH